MAVSNVVAFQRPDSLFETILVPTDGSALSIAAALKTVALSKRLQTRMLVFHSVLAYRYPVYVGGVPFEYPSEANYEDQCRTIASRHLTLIAGVAAAQNVEISTRIEFNESPAQAIIEMARRENCGLIVMGSHGRGGLSSLFLGSVAVKTLTLAHIPIMLDRATQEEIRAAEAIMRQRAIEP